MLYNMKHTFVNVLLINHSKTKHKKGKKINKQIIAPTIVVSILTGKSTF